MRKTLFYMALFLVGCSNGDGEFLVAANLLPPDQHVPEITAVTISPDSAMLMEGDGDILATAEVTFIDPASDVRHLVVGSPGDSVRYYEVDPDTAVGTFTEEILLSTEMFGAFELQFRLVDRAGNDSNTVSADFHVVEETDWTNRLSGLPSMNDVTWDGTVFIAVGNDGSILTSADGIDWVTRDAGIDDNLDAVAAFGPDIFAVGGQVALLSTDHGESWIRRNIPDGLALRAVSLSATKVVAAGSGWEMFAPTVIVSDDRGITWKIVATGIPAWFTDLAYWDGLFVATAETLMIPIPGDGQILVSADGEVWDELLNDGESGLLTVTPAGNQLIAGGRFGTVLASLDGFNWMAMQTPEADAHYASSAWNGSRIVLAGDAWELYMFELGPPSHYVPVGVSSTDNGATWETFNIDGHYWSQGLAWGNGRFVSVGWRPLAEEGAIYTAE